MIEAVKLWNEPNNKSHWNFDEVDGDWQMYAELVKQASAAIAAERPSLTRVLGGISPIDPDFLLNMRNKDVLDAVDAVAIHGFPLDWNHWQIDEWPAKVDAVRAVVGDKSIWVTEVGVSTFGAEEVQAFGLRRTAELLARTPVDRVHWYSLFDLPSAWPATTRHREAEGSSYYRHFHMGLVREDGMPKLAFRQFAEHAPAMGICQWFHFEDHRLEHAVRLLGELGVTKLRTGLSWADSFRPGADAWFDRQMKALEPFDVTITFCFTPEHCGIVPHHTSPPRCSDDFAEFCARMVRRYC